jgi:hypothetical protein
MTVYGNSTLYNLAVHEQSKEALQHKYISKHSYNTILQSHPVDLYQPNIAVRLGLGFLIVFIILAAMGLCLLIYTPNGSIGNFCILSGVACYAAAEMMTKNKRHYNSGVDNILLIAVPGLILPGIETQMQNGETLISFISFAICLWLAIRFADALMGIAAAVSALFFVFYFYVNLGEFTITTFPFVLMIMAAVMYIVSERSLKRDRLIIYHHHFKLTRLLALIAFYLSGNVYCVDGISNDTYLLQADSPLTMAWFFWSWTMIVPIVYFVRGVKIKDEWLVRLSIIFMAVAVLTFRVYHAILAAELALMIAGVVLIGVSYWLMKYLQQPKHGFVFEDDDTASRQQADIEALVVGETFSHQAVPVEENTFGGGSFGGAGAGSNY